MAKPSTSRILNNGETADKVRLIWDFSEPHYSLETWNNFNFEQINT